MNKPEGKILLFTPKQDKPDPTPPPPPPKGGRQGRITRLDLTDAIVMKAAGCPREMETPNPFSISPDLTCRILRHLRPVGDKHFA